MPAYTRGPALLAQSAASLADAAPGRFALGIGASSPAIVERWNGIPFVDPFRRTRDTVRFLRQALTGEKVTERYDTFEVQGFRLGLVPEIPPTILVAALRPGMLKLAGEEGDGAIINWLSAADVAQIKPYVGDKEIVARIFVAPTDDFDVVRTMAAPLDHELPQRRGVREVPRVARSRCPCSSRCGTRGPPVTAPARSSSCPTR